MDGQWPKEPKTMNLLESWLETELSLSYVDSDHNRLVITRKNKQTVLNKKSSSQSNPRKVCSYIFL